MPNIPTGTLFRIDTESLFAKSPVGAKKKGAEGGN